MPRIISTILGVLWTLWMYYGMRMGQWLGPRVKPDSPMNCILWAFQQKHKQPDGSLEFVTSQYGRWFHCRFNAPDGTSWEFVPIKNRRHFWLLKMGFPPPIFNGFVKRHK